MPSLPFSDARDPAPVTDRVVPIELGSRESVAYWTERFACTSEDLNYALRKVGTSSERVGAYLKRQARTA